MQEEGPITLKPISIWTIDLSLLLKLKSKINFNLEENKINFKIKPINILIPL